MGEGEDDSGSLDSDSDLILDGENAAGVGPGKFIFNLTFVMDKENPRIFEPGEYPSKNRSLYHKIISLATV